MAAGASLNSRKTDVCRISTESANTDNTDKFKTERLTRRSIRSFVVRNGRTTSAQADAIERLLPHYGIRYSDSTIDLSDVFERQAPCWMEVGFGNADVLLDLAKNHPGINILGVEVHTAGIGQALMGIEKNQLSNLRVIQHDAMEVLQHMLRPATLERILLLFPDPWHKKKHHKRRILQKDFLQSVATALVDNGLLHCATDWQDYAQWMFEFLESDPNFTNLAGAWQPSPRPQWRPITRFEQRGHRLGHEVSDLLFTRQSRQSCSV